ncbi:hypothetical protein CBW65_10295 [Tumebacillus avium]|uniref:Uncharacterized protein n=1 Tax=Tumebacillus avium TaxID=1903704 RepID=A0A1Y0INE7_9BACL|nr:hypothetical protein [Tumebacillus avium]ARU61346.1 hypothetical protein CBW65_10295 [Tumebacillus avium]
MKVHETEWSRHFKALFQARLGDMQEMLLEEFFYDGTHLKVEIGVIQDSIIGRNSPYLFQVALEHNGRPLISVHLEDFEELERNRGLVEFLETVDGTRMPLGQAYKFNKIEVAPGLETNEIKAVAQALTLLIHDLGELIFGEEVEMARQPLALQETWKHVYGPDSGKVVDFNGIKYIRFDDARGWHSF